MQTIIASLVADLTRERAKNRHLRHLLDTMRNHDQAVDWHNHDHAVESHDNDQDDIGDGTIYPYPPLRLVPPMQLSLGYLGL